MDFKTGLYKLNENTNYNYQLNRFINWSGADLKEVSEVSKNIKSNIDWKNTFIKLGDKSIEENRIENAIAYYRMSEFFMSSKDPDKLKYYNKAVKLFYEFNDDYFTKGVVEKINIPFENTFLPVLFSESKTSKKGRIILHGGNDSYLEELFFHLIYLSNKGYDVYLFEGPGQGGVLRNQGLKFTYKWEEPMKVILDYLNLEDVVIIGVSLGGMLAPRAAAFDKRIKYVVAWSVFTNFLEIALYDFPKVFKFFIHLALKLRLKSILNLAANIMINRDPFMEWAFEHGMYAYGADSPFDYLSKLGKFEMMSIGKDVDQDILILHGKQDHIINWNLYSKEIEVLTNAKSVTFRLFTEKEQASDHCQCGNTKLALDTILSWLDLVKK